MQGQCIGRTETVKDSLKFALQLLTFLMPSIFSPKFTKPFILDYVFEEEQMLRFVVVDMDDEGAPMEKQDFLGEISISLGNLGTNSTHIS